VIEVPDLATRFNGSTRFTISFWIKSAMVPQDEGFWEVRDSGGADTWGIRYDDEGATAGGDDIIKLGMTFDTSASPDEGVDQQESMENVQTTEWQHLVMVWESGVGFSLYIDGQLDNPTSAMQTTEGALAEMDRFRLGDGAKGFWTGQISEVAVWGDAALTEDEVQWLVNNSLRGLSDLPRVTNLSPTRGTSFHPSGDGISFNAVVEAPKTIPEDGITLTLNGEDVSSELTISGDGQDRSVTFTGLEDNKVYTGNIEVVDSEGETSSATLSFNTFDLDLAKIVEAEDYNFSDGGCDSLTGNVTPAPTAGGEFLNDPEPSAFVGGSYVNQDSGYVDRVGMRGVDFFDNKEARDPDNDDIQNFQYRFCDPVGTQETTDQTRQKHEDAGVPDYQLHLVEAGEWWNYTRDFEEGNYQVFLRTSAGADQSLELAEVTSDRSQGDQTTVTLGNFEVPSGGFQFVPLVGVGGQPLVLEISGEQTFRVTALEADNNINPNYIMFVPTDEAASVIGPLAENLTPAPDSTDASRKTPIEAEIRNRATDLDDSTVQLEVDGEDVTADTDVSSTADGAAVSHPPAGEFGPGSEHTVVLSYSDTEGNPFTVEWSFTVSTDVEGPTLLGAVASLDGSDLSVNVGFSEAIDPVTATNPDNYNIDQGVSIDSVEMTESDSIVVINASGGASDTRYILTVNNVEDAIGNLIEPDSRVAFNPSTFQQGEDGLVVIEAESFHANNPGTDHDWVFRSDVDGFSGIGFMRAEPDAGPGVEPGPPNPWMRVGLPNRAQAHP
jgi:hypothetical protein